MLQWAGELDFADFFIDLNIINLFLLKEPIIFLKQTLTSRYEKTVVSYQSIS